MSIHERALDRLVASLLDRRRHRCGRPDCPICGGRRFEAAPAGRVPAPPATARRVGTPRSGTREGPLSLDDWGGWRNGVVLKDLIAAALHLDARMAERGGGGGKPVPRDLLAAIPPALWPYFSVTSGLYRIEVAGQPVPVDIGMVVSQVPGFRILKHFRPAARIRSGAARHGGKGRYDARVGAPRKFVPGENAAVVHLGHFRRKLLWQGRPDRRILHAYEILLQRRERARTYNPATWTFED
ncbi:hypothetical protein [Amaricoccus solimangrovi]|uniref:Uncharacterized protein n=1 Tax=Amaricoccus solimangrovi TaxID=2589815 RepID=A0A501WYD0_9RHOB|nr:hypothetical protein [Amaricoccus solimangrovi]TPE53244.1 hypothetical protein FJM51_04290 [Amaricoccus solimangrovi]